MTSTLYAGQLRTRTGSLVATSTGRLLSMKACGSFSGTSANSALSGPSRMTAKTDIRTAAATIPAKRRNKEVTRAGDGSVRTDCASRCSRPSGGRSSANDLAERGGDRVVGFCLDNIPQRVHAIWDRAFEIIGKDLTVG